jgi:hypothetical protein
MDAIIFIEKLEIFCLNEESDSHFTPASSGKERYNAEKHHAT